MKMGVHDDIVYKSTLVNAALTFPYVFIYSVSNPIP